MLVCSSFCQNVVLLWPLHMRKEMKITGSQVQADDGGWSNTSHRKRFGTLFVAAAICSQALSWSRTLVVVVVVLGFTTLLTSQVICIAFYSEHKKSDKFCSEALISAWDSFTCHKSTIWDPWLYFPSEGTHTQDFTLWKIPRSRPGLNPWTLDPVASMITTGPPGPTRRTVPENNFPRRLFWIKESNYSIHSTFGIFTGSLRAQNWHMWCIAISRHTKDIAQHICAKLNLILTVVLISRSIGPWIKKKKKPSYINYVCQQ